MGSCCSRYCIYHVKFKVCLVTKPLGGWIMWKMYNKTIIEFGFRMISWIIKTSCLCYLPQPSASADNTDLGLDNSWYHAQLRSSNNCLWSICGQTHEFKIHGTRQRARAGNSTICYRKKQIDVSFQCVCPVIDHEFRHNIAKVVLRIASWNHSYFDNVMTKFMINNRTDA